MLFEKRALLALIALVPMAWAETCIRTNTEVSFDTSTDLKTLTSCSHDGCHHPQTVSQPAAQTTSALSTAIDATKSSTPIVWTTITKVITQGTTVRTTTAVCPETEASTIIPPELVTTKGPSSLPEPSTSEMVSTSSVPSAIATTRGSSTPIVWTTVTKVITQGTTVRTTTTVCPETEASTIIPPPEPITTNEPNYSQGLTSVEATTTSVSSVSTAGISTAARDSTIESSHGPTASTTFSGNEPASTPQSSSIEEISTSDSSTTKFSMSTAIDSGSSVGNTPAAARSTESSSPETIWTTKVTTITSGTVIVTTTTICPASESTKDMDVTSTSPPAEISSSGQPSNPVVSKTSSRLRLTTAEADEYSSQSHFQTSSNSFQKITSSEVHCESDDCTTSTASPPPGSSFQSDRTTTEAGFNGQSSENLNSPSTKSVVQRSTTTGLNTVTCTASECDKKSSSATSTAHVLPPPPSEEFSTASESISSSTTVSPAISSSSGDNAGKTGPYGFSDTPEQVNNAVYSQPTCGNLAVFAAAAAVMALHYF